MSYNPNCGRCGMLNHWGQCQLTACRYPVQESGVINGSAYVAKIVTNADRIRGMTDYDLADWIAKILTYHQPFSVDDECPTECPLYKCCNDQPSDNIEDWLKSPVEVDNA